MSIKHGMVLAAGLGKRMQPLTLKTPKPLLKFKNLTMLEHTINFIENLGLNKIIINTFYLEKQIIDFIFNHPLKKKIEIISDGKKILGTGGGILNMINSTSEKDFLVFNPDTLWNSNYLVVVNKMCKIYFKNEMENCLLLVRKEKSFDTRFNGDFGMISNILNKKNKDLIYTGCQIINKNLFNGYKKNFFSISKFWNKKLKEKDLYGIECEEEFIHLTDFEIYNKLLKNN